MIDSHAHYDDEQYDADRHEVLMSALDEGVTHIVNPGADAPSSEAAVGLAETYPHVYAAVGIHPHAASTWTAPFAEHMREWLKQPKVVAVGEIGLDYHYDYSPRDVQREVFVKQIEIAIAEQKPVIVHDREAHQDMLDTLKATHAEKAGGVIHMYSGSVEMAKLLLDMNFYIGLGGPVTFKNASRVLDVVRYVPADRLLIETDSPYMSPVPHRGKRNRSGWLREVLAIMAPLRGISTDELDRQTTENAIRLFGLQGV